MDLEVLAISRVGLVITHDALTLINSFSIRGVLLVAFLSTSCRQKQGCFFYCGFLGFWGFLCEERLSGLFEQKVEVDKRKGT